jgi:hypothetical protein
MELEKGWAGFSVTCLDSIRGTLPSKDEGKGFEPYRINNTLESTNSADESSLVRPKVDVGLEERRKACYQLAERVDELASHSSVFSQVEREAPCPLL